MDADAHPLTSHEVAEPAHDEPLPALDDAHLLTRGRTSDVYLLNDTQVVRRLRDPQDSFRNVDLVRHLTAEHFPTARLVRAHGPDLIMERLNGATLLQALDVQDVSIPEGARILLDLHDRLHAVPLPPDVLATGRCAPGDSILHLDLHPANVLMTSDGPYLIDWESAGFGHPALDLATTALVFAEIVADGNEYAHPAHAMLRVFVQLAGPELGDHLETAAALRAGHTTTDPEELALIPAARAVVEDELGRYRSAQRTD